MAIVRLNCWWDAAFAWQFLIFQPCWIQLCLTTMRWKSKKARMNNARSFNKQHGSRNLEPLTPGEDVWITDAQVQDTGVSPQNTPQLYLVQVPRGTLRRNRHNLVPLQTNGCGVSSGEPAGEESTTQESAHQRQHHTAERTPTTHHRDCAYKVWKRD